MLLILLNTMKKDNALKKAWTSFRKFWDYVWNGDDYKSLLLSIVVAFVIIKFIFYPVVGLTLSTTHPIVAVVSGSMEHKITDSESELPSICGQQFTETGRVDLERYWKVCGSWYEDINISQEEFSTFSFSKGMNIGDIIILRNPGADKIEIGDVIVFIQEQNPRREPIIHRVVDIYEKNNLTYFQTKGDHNRDSINVSTPAKYLNEYEVSEHQLVGKSIARIPWLGYVKILAYDAFMWVVNLAR